MSRLEVIDRDIIEVIGKQNCALAALFVNSKAAENAALEFFPVTENDLNTE